MRTPLTILYLALIALSACTKVMDAPALKQKAAKDLLGIWTLEKRTDEFFSPVDTLKSTTVYNGTEDDFYIFQKDELVSVSEAGKPLIQKRYALISSKQIFISPDDHSNYWHMDLEGNHLRLFSWINNAATNTGHRVTIYLKK